MYKHPLSRYTSHYRQEENSTTVVLNAWAYVSELCFNYFIAEHHDSVIILWELINQVPTSTITVKALMRRIKLYNDEAALRQLQSILQDNLLQLNPDMERHD